MYFDVDVSGEYILSTWHPRYSIIAVTKNDGSVEILNDEGIRINKETIKKDSSVSFISWHSIKKFLFIAWINGTISIWNAYDNVLKEESIHKNRIKCYKWSPNSNKLITIDIDNKLVLWKIDRRGRIFSLYQNNFKADISQCMFHPIINIRKTRDNDENISFFLGGNNGIIYYVNDKFQCIESTNVYKPILSLKLFEKQGIILAITEDMSLYEYEFRKDGKLFQIAKLKLSAGINSDKSRYTIDWVGIGLLAICSGEQYIRILNLNTEENYNITSPILNSGNNENFMKMSFNTNKNILAAGTDKGNIYLWKCNIKRNTFNECTYSWEYIYKMKVQNAVESLEWGGNGNMLLAKCDQALSLFGEQKLFSDINKDKIVYQIGSGKLLITHLDGNNSISINTSNKIKGVSISHEYIAIWDGKIIEVSKFDRKTIESVGIIKSDSLIININDQDLYIADGLKIDICNFQGTVKQSLVGLENEGEICSIHSANNYLVVGTTNKCLKIIDTSKREAKILYTKTFDDIDVECISSLKCSYTGNYISFMNSSSVNDNKLYVYDNEKAIVMNIDFSELNLKPINYVWDSTDQRLLICEVEAINSNDHEFQSNQSSSRTNEIIFLYISPDNKILTHSRIPLDNNIFIGSSVPFIYSMKRVNDNDDKNSEIVLDKQIMKGYSGIDCNDSTIIKHMMNFCYYITIGNLDEAFKSVHMIKNKEVWENMAKMSIKTKRLDVASICLGNMGNAVAVQALNELSSDESNDVKLATIAIYLGMNEEAEKLFLSAKSYDKLSQFYQAKGEWKKAIDIVTNYNKINIKPTYYNYGKYLEEMGEYDEAIQAYEKSGNSNFEIPRIYLKVLKDENKLKEYVENSSDKSIHKWWAQYCELKNDFEEAIKYYEKAEEISLAVKVLCSSGKLNEAIKLAETANNPAADFHIGRQYENQRNIKEAIKFYSNAKCYSYAIALAKDYKLETDLMQLALKSTPELMIDVARYFEDVVHEYDKAINLYYKGENVSKALDLCFKHQQYELLGDILMNLDENLDISTLRKCIDYFLEKKDFEKAIHLYIRSGQYEDAIDLCLAHNVIITEDMADRFNDTENPQRNKEINLKLAKTCLQQKSFHLACKKFTQIGDRLSAMKSLLCSGDTEKIIFFANVSGPKQKEIFILAGNYLQTLDWRNNSSITKNIIQFYTKGKAYDSIAKFFESCAQVEIDDYQNYQEAVKALNEAKKYIEKIKDMGDTSKSINVERYTSNIDKRIGLINQFIKAKECGKDNNIEEMMNICQTLLKEDLSDSYLNIGDIYALMIESSLYNGNVNDAQTLLGIMKQKVPLKNFTYYLDSRIIQKLDPSILPMVQSDDIEEDFHEQVTED
ncbi:WD40 repeat-like protein [Piromyces finnis]|uniref:WD40 repeat-like protein n=1 Tax=Piromyces finnis TaxID=1754191 RepID=A0A1Y1VEC8_9FUNG|nr:WD40 repeat-like protein [Piromyces finnis]|eukprot:ORX53869.1 WD40 repeat-like protein [Piromyces finnis]